jgi:transposase-like protein
LKFCLICGEKTKFKKNGTTYIITVRNKEKEEDRYKCEKCGRSYQNKRKQQTLSTVSSV